MFTLLTAIDEADNVCFSDLLTYVSENPDNMPSVRNVAQDIYNIRSKVTKIESRVQSVQQRAPCSSQSAQLSANNNVITRSADCAVVNGAVGQSTTTAAPVTFGISSSWEVVNETADQVVRFRSDNWSFNAEN